MRLVAGYCCLLVAAMLSNYLYGPQGVPSLDRDAVQDVPTVTIHGYIVGEFNQWGQWNNQAKVFDLVDDVVVQTETKKLAFVTNEMYRKAERYDGQAVEIKAVKANRENNEWYVVLGVELLP